MKKNVPALRLVDADEAPDLPELSDELRAAMADIAETVREGLLAMSVGVGLRVLAEMMEEELTAKVGPRHAKLAGRRASRHGTAPGSVVLGGRRVRVERPRARTADGQEVTLEAHAAVADDDVLANVVMERMLAGLATRRHRAANEPVGAEVEASATSTSKSAVSRRFVARTKRALEELMARDLSELQVAALMVDGVNFAEHCCVVALAVTTDGTKVPVGLWLGDTENKTVVTHLLADLVDGAFRPTAACWWSSTGPRPWSRRWARSSATRPWCSAAPCTSAETWPTICPTSSGGGWTSAWLGPSTTPIPTPGCARPATSPARSSSAGPTPRPACGKGSSRCSPCAAWAWATGWPAASPTPT